MENNRIPLKAKRFFSDTIWSISGLVFMNAVAQFAVYPYWNRILGSAAYGSIVYHIAVMNILAISLGSGVNYARMRMSAEGDTKNRPYLLLLSAGTVVSLLILILLYAAGTLKLSGPEFVLFCALTAATSWRYYADVEYRLHVDYKGYFLFYLIIGLGYLPGIWLFRSTGLWPLTLLPGELAGLLCIFLRGSILRRDDVPAGVTAPLLKLALLLVGTNVLSHLVFNGDRLILNFFAGEVAVSVYYIASLLGKTMTLISTPLNGVLVGHLAKYSGKLTSKLMRTVTGLSLAAILLATLACTAVSLILLPLLYPVDFQAARPYLLPANAAQVIYFAGNILTASVLLRFTPARNQVIVNASHGVLFALVCVPATLLNGIGGFCVALLLVNTVRLVLCLLLGYQEERRRKHE